jgi:hypothetical protein
MKIAREVFGTTFGVGARNLPPCKGYPQKILEIGNIMNLINVSEGAVALSFKELIKEQIIFFCRRSSRGHGLFGLNIVTG